jgi:iron(III) transport system ATP-binding protein
MSLGIRNLSVSYGPVVALQNVSLDLEPGEMFFLLGPSGCGKSTLLRAVAGFIEDLEGELRFDGESLKGLPPDKRNFGMVFQNYALFPHLTVMGNVVFGLEARRCPASEVRARSEEALELVGLTGFAQRRPGELSGGQQQRVALARALVIRPRLLLLDEPLSNLDAKLRWEMRAEIRRIHRQTRLTTLYVTHDQKEALSLADRVAILREGRVEAVGRPRDLYYDPPTRFVAGFLGELNVLSGTVISGPAAPEGSARVRTALGEFQAPRAPAGGRVLGTGQEVQLFCRPEAVVLAGEGRPGALEGFQTLNGQARVAGSAFLGEFTLYELDLPGGVRWRASSREGNGQGFPEGAALSVAVAAEAWRVLPE